MKIVGCKYRYKEYYMIHERTNGYIDILTLDDCLVSRLHLSDDDRYNTDKKIKIFDEAISIFENNNVICDNWNAIESIIYSK